MTVSSNQILEVLSSYDIRPMEDNFSEIDLPGIGEIEDGEGIYTTSLKEIFSNNGDIQSSDWPKSDDPRLKEWEVELDEIIESSSKGDWPDDGLLGRVFAQPTGQPEHPCAWYCPIHYFGHGWGIFIREDCILSHALDIAKFVPWSSVHLSKRKIRQQLLRSSFYVFFLHEQFHHKVESLGLRLLVATNKDHYRPYKKNVYRSTFLKPNCLEESLANAESLRRLSENRYSKRVDPSIRNGLKEFLKWSIPLQSPGYREGINFVSDRNYRDGLYKLQSQMLDGCVPPTTDPSHWSIAPNMITAISNIADDIYLILPKGSRPIFNATSVDPGSTASSQVVEGALKKHYGYHPVRGGKGSHVKLAKPKSPTIILPGNRSTLTPGVVKHVLDVIGGYPISRLPDLLSGKLEERAQSKKFKVVSSNSTHFLKSIY